MTTSDPSTATSARLDTADLLGRDSFEVDDEYAHISIDPAVCRACPHHACVSACPASLFSCGSDAEMHFDHAGCLECGTCRVVCTPGGIVRWTYPHSGFGVVFRFS